MKDRKKIILSTNNQDKLKELEALVDRDHFDLKTKADFQLDDLDIEETGGSLEENALLKVMGLVSALEAKEEDVTEAYIIADDTGLFVDALDGRPGVYSSRYAGEKVSYEDNVNKLLKELMAVPDEERGAYFATVLACYHRGETFCVEGRLEGRISRDRAGQDGFGYDPVFYIDDREKTLAQLTKEEKNAISHRGRAYRELIRRLEDDDL